MLWDREAILAAIDREAMVQLADELLGPHRGSERSPTWRCPDPDHPGQTGRTPPVTIFSDRMGEQRWYCHACGAGGTAIDLVVQVTDMTVRDALGVLARRTGTASPAGAPYSRPQRAARPVNGPRHIDPFRRPAHPRLDRYVAQCAEALWRPEGTGALRWLTEDRGLPEPTLRANRVGLDLGKRRQPRPEGVPNVNRAIVLPVLVSDGACFVQLRILNGSPDFPKYLNSRGELSPNPRLGRFDPAPTPHGETQHREVIITEGIFDALSATVAGYRSVAFLAAGYPDRATALALARIAGPLVIAFDPDPAGEAGARRLVGLLASQRREAAVISMAAGDLNACAARSGDWPVELAARVEHATYPLRRLPPVLVQGPG